MSTNENQLYTENIWTEFQEALEDREWDTCERIITATKQAGFQTLANSLKEALSHAKPTYPAFSASDHQTFRQQEQSYLNSPADY